MDNSKSSINWDVLKPPPDEVPPPDSASGTGSSVSETTYTISEEVIGMIMTAVGFVILVLAVVLALYFFAYATPFEFGGSLHPDIHNVFGLVALVGGFLSALLCWAGASVVVNLAAMRRLMEQRR